MNSKARQDEAPEDAPSEGASPLPRTSTLRASNPPGFAADPRAVYTRALVNVARAGDVAHLLVPSQILDAFCQAVAEPLGLLVAVLVDAPDGLPRALPWKAVDTDWRLVERAERRAWETFAELLAPELLSSLPPESSGPHADSDVHWTVHTLVIPLLGILECGTRQPVRGADNGLLRYMSMRLSNALERRLTRG